MVTCQEKDLYCKIRIFWQISDNNLPFTTAPITSLTGRLGPRTSSLASARTSWLPAGPPRWPLPSWGWRLGRSSVTRSTPGEARPRQTRQHWTFLATSSDSGNVKANIVEKKDFSSMPWISLSMRMTLPSSSWSHQSYCSANREKSGQPVYRTRSGMLLTSIPNNLEFSRTLDTVDGRELYCQGGST